MPEGDDEVLAEDAPAAVAPDAIVLAGYLRLIPMPVLAEFSRRILNVHPSLLPTSPGAPRPGRCSCSGHYRDRRDRVHPGGRVARQRADRGADPCRSCRRRGHAALDPPGGARRHAACRWRWRRCSRAQSWRQARVAQDRPGQDGQAVPKPAGAVDADKIGLVELGEARERGWELFSTWALGADLREAGTAVAGVAPAMGWIAGDARRAREDLPRSPGSWRSPPGRPSRDPGVVGIAPFDLVVINLTAARRAAGDPFDELVEEIGISRPSMVRLPRRTTRPWPS
ncbi:MAG: formyltransferase family protein [Chloroflexota bacterium]